MATDSSAAASVCSLATCPNSWRFAGSHFRRASTDRDFHCAVFCGPVSMELCGAHLPCGAPRGACIRASGTACERGTPMLRRSVRRLLHAQQAPPPGAVFLLHPCFVALYGLRGLTSALGLALFYLASVFCPRSAVRSPESHLRARPGAVVSCVRRL